MARLADAATFVRVGARERITPGEPLLVTVGRYDIAIFEVEGTLHAYENTCPHQGGPIGEGRIEGTVVTCPWHGWRFDLRTGTMTLGDFARLRRFAVRVDAGGEICVASEPEEA